jgi:hypothetical protein
MKKQDVKVDALVTRGNPLGFDIWRVTDVDHEADRISVINVRTNKAKVFSFTEKNLRLVPMVISLATDAEALISQFVKITLRDGGMTTGTCTAIIYAPITVLGNTFFRATSIELDTSAMSTYKLDDIESIESN